jgi:tripartite-type tricarboxylate transporter receptor subunit TctC
LHLAAAAAVLPIASRVAGAETYPSRSITMLVGFPPGGPTDTLARILSEAMQRSLGQSVVVETVSGASGTIATGRVAHGSRDGYTIVIGNWASNVGAPAIYPLNFDVSKDLQPISLLAASPLWILGKNALPPKTATELIAWLNLTQTPSRLEPWVPVAPLICVGSICRERPMRAFNTCRTAEPARRFRI